MGSRLWNGRAPKRRQHALGLNGDASTASTRGAQYLAGARQYPSHDLLKRIAPKSLVRIAPTVIELVFLGRGVTRQNLACGGRMPLGEGYKQWCFASCLAS